MVPRLPALLLVVLCSFAALAHDPGLTDAEIALRTAPRHTHKSLEVESDAATPVSRFDQGVFGLQANDVITPGANPLDLVGSTLRAEPAGDDRFKVTRMPLAARNVTGTPVAMRNNGAAGWWYRQQELPFAFPFGGQTYRTIYISPLGGIYFAQPPQPPRDQYDRAAALAVPKPLIAPLLIGTSPRWTETQVRTRDFGNAFAISWTFIGTNNDPDVRFGGEVQAVLNVNGTIELSYISVARFLGGSVVITTGDEAMRAQRTTLATIADAAGDGTSNVDIRSFEVSTLDALDLVELRLELAAPPPTPISANVVFQAPNKFLQPVVRATGLSDVSYAWWSTSLPVIHISGSTIRVLFAEDWMIPPGNFKVEVTLTADGGAKYDTVTATNVAIPAATSIPDIDISASNATTLTLPIVEPFTVPAVHLDNVWSALVSQHGLSREVIDQVVIYTSFPTSLEYFAASGSIQGNPGVDGLGSGHSSDESRRFPSLTYLGTAERMGALLHETAHRWVFYSAIMENGQRVQIGNGHLPSNMDSTAALVRGGQSPMGGVPFVDRGNGNYDVVCGDTGFTWLELYLMGLAAAAEVPPVLQITEGRVDWFCGGTAQATKIRRFTVEQVQQVNRPRKPSFAEAPNVFPIAYVLIDDAAMSIIPDAHARVRSYISEHQRQFSTATGGRGRLSLVTGPPRRKRPAY